MAAIIKNEGNGMKKRIIAVSLISVINLSYPVYASQTNVRQLEATSNNIDITVDKFISLENITIRHYLDNLVWPSTITSDAKTPYGHITSKKVGNNYLLTLQFRRGGEALAKKIADLLDAKVINNAVNLTLSPPTSTSLMDGFVSRTTKAGQPQLQRFETDLDLGNNTINHINIINAKTINTDNATFNSLTNSGNTLLSNVEINGHLSVPDLHVNQQSQLTNNMNIAKQLSTNDLHVAELKVDSSTILTKLTAKDAEINGMGILKKGASITGNAQLNGNVTAKTVNSDIVVATDAVITESLLANNATIDSLNNLREINIERELHQNNRIVLGSDGQLYEQNVALQNRLASLNKANTFLSTVTINGNVIANQGHALNGTKATHTRSGHVIVGSKDLAALLNQHQSVNNAIKNDITAVSDTKNILSISTDNLEKQRVVLQTNATKLSTRLNQLESDVNKASTTASSSSKNATDALNVALAHGRQISTSLSQVASLEQFERDCRAKKNGLCVVKPPKPTCSSGSFDPSSNLCVEIREICEMTYNNNWEEKSCPAMWCNKTGFTVEGVYYPWNPPSHFTRFNGQEMKWKTLHDSYGDDWYYIRTHRKGICFNKRITTNPQ
ncbi:hypothetical protein C0W66_21325 [Photobacterium kishitanii]|nr:hypothetical protein AYY23_19425 [Photobacterium kishitanii]PSW46849.1 hypothetical protein C0W66_21325 [Photobacterium kishitanii]